jgi:L-amino acid N-acyltransferase YncA
VEAVGVGVEEEASRSEAGMPESARMAKIWTQAALRTRATFRRTPPSRKQRAHVLAAKRAAAAQRYTLAKRQRGDGRRRSEVVQRAT